MVKDIIRVVDLLNISVALSSLDRWLRDILNDSGWTLGGGGGITKGSAARDRGLAGHSSAKG